MFWGRVVSLSVGHADSEGVNIRENFRIIFSIKKTSTKEPNRSKIRIYNASESTRKILHQPNNKAILRAGYSEESGLVLLFFGDIFNSITYQDGPDIITELSLGDGYTTIRDSLISVSFPPNTKAIDVLRTVAGNMGLSVRPIPEIKDRTYVSGFSYCGQSYRALDKVCAYLGAEWSIQNNELQILLSGGVVDQKAIVLSSNTGMIGSPSPEEQTFSEKRARERGLIGKENVIEIVNDDKYKSGKNKGQNKASKYHVYGYNVSSYLLPHIAPGNFVQLDTKFVNGVFRVDTVEHFGDTFGDEFRTDMSLRSLNNAKS